MKGRIVFYLKQDDFVITTNYRGTTLTNMDAKAHDSTH